MGNFYRVFTKHERNSELMPVREDVDGKLGCYFWSEILNGID